MQSQVILKRTGLVLIAIGLLWLAVTVGGAGIFRQSAPQKALWFDGNDARALTNLADRIYDEKATRADINRAAVYSRLALQRDPTMAAAVRMIAFAEEGSKAENRMFFASRMTKRDFKAQVWLIEHAAARDDVPGALGHFDAALRTSDLAQPLLFPILSNAMSDPKLLPHIIALLKKRPPWAEDFMFEAINSASSPAALLLAFSAIKSPDIDSKGQIVRNLVQRTARDQRNDLARQLLVQAKVPQAATAAVFNGGFDQEPDYLPFNWALTADGKLEAFLAPAEAKGNRLEVRAVAGTNSHAARQLLMLAPGRYIMAADGGRVDGTKGQAMWKIGCAPESYPILAGSPAFADREGGSRIEVSFTVPSGNCSGQWVSLNTRSELDSGDFSFWIDNVSIRPAQ